MLSGRRARQGGTPAAIALRASDPPPDLRELRPEASALAAALARGMANDPARRPPSASAFADDVADALEQDARSADPTQPLTPVPAAVADEHPAPAPQDTAEVTPA